MLAVRAAQIQESFCAFDFESHRGERNDCLRNSCARALGILSIVMVVMENEVHFVWWLFCSRSVSSNVGSSLKSVPWRCSRVALAASLGASSNVQERWRQAFVVMLVFFHLCARVQNPMRHERLHCAEAQVQHCLVPTHGLCEELHGLLFDDVLQGLGMSAGCNFAVWSPGTKST